jgi:hypothetical protein
MDLKFCTQQYWDSYAALHGFRSTENWGDPLKMAEQAVDNLIAYRSAVQGLIHINAGYALTGHVPTGYHPKGMAIDFSVQGAGYLECLRTLIDITDGGEYLFGGIGAYPDWHTPGFHGDIRQYEQKSRVFWIETIPGSADYKYFSESEEFFDAVSEIVRKSA